MEQEVAKYRLNVFTDASTTDLSELISRTHLLVNNTFLLNQTNPSIARIAYTIKPSSNREFDSMYSSNTLINAFAPLAPPSTITDIFSKEQKNFSIQSVIQGQYSSQSYFFLLQLLFKHDVDALAMYSKKFSEFIFTPLNQHPVTKRKFSEFLTTHNKTII